MQRCSVTFILSCGTARARESLALVELKSLLSLLILQICMTRAMVWPFVHCFTMRVRGGLFVLKGGTVCFFFLSFCASRSLLPLAGDAKEILLCSFTPSRQAHFSPGQPSFLCPVCATVYLFPRCKTIIHRNIHHGCFLVDGCELLPISFPPWRSFLPRERERKKTQPTALCASLE